MTAAAIRISAPHLSRARALTYGAEIDRAVAGTGIDPLLVVALVHRESRWRRGAVSGRNFGLGQLRVSASTRPRYLGREAELLRPCLNLRLTVRALLMWRAYHRRRCGAATHPWWSHYQHGARVRSDASAKRVDAVRRDLRVRVEARR